MAIKGTITEIGKFEDDIAYVKVVARNSLGGRRTFTLPIAPEELPALREQWLWKTVSMELDVTIVFDDAGHR